MTANKGSQMGVVFFSSCIPAHWIPSSQFVENEIKLRTPNRSDISDIIRTTDQHIDTILID